MGFPTKNEHVGVFWGYHHLRKHPYATFDSELRGIHVGRLVEFEGPKIQVIHRSSPCEKENHRLKSALVKDMWYASSQKIHWNV